MRPATTLTLALLILVILVAGLYQLLVRSDERRCRRRAPIRRSLVRSAALRSRRSRRGTWHREPRPSIDDHAADNVALISRGRPTTYGELRDQVAPMRGGLAGLGVGRGDRVALLCGNGRYFVDAYLAVLGLGAVAVPLNPTSPPPRSTRRSPRSAPRSRSSTRSAAVGLGGDRRPACPRSNTSSPPTASAIERRASASTSCCRHTPVPIVEVEPDDARRADLHERHRRLARAPRCSATATSARTSTRAARRSCGVQSDDVVYGVLPLFHIFGLNVVLGLVARPRRDASCWSSASTRRPRSTRSASAASP